jgi:hypothetical protein
MGEHPRRRRPSPPLLPGPQTSTIRRPPASLAKLAAEGARPRSPMRSSTKYSPRWISPRVRGAHPAGKSSTGITAEHSPVSSAEPSGGLSTGPASHRRLGGLGFLRSTDTTRSSGEVSWTRIAYGDRGFWPPG